MAAATELRDIEIFLTPAEELHFGRTAQRLRVTPARVSQAIKKQERGDVDHTFLTSIIDQSGTLRVQYLGVRFDPNEFLRMIGEKPMEDEGMKPVERNGAMAGRR